MKKWRHNGVETVRFLITGGTGFIGRRLVKGWLEDRHQVYVLSRQHAREVKRALTGSVQHITSLSAVNPSVYFDAVVNLAGEGIMDRRWSHTRKAELLESRVGITSELVDLMERMESRPGCLISGSAIGYYGSHPSDVRLDEQSGEGADFAATLCARWEQVAKRVEALGVRTCIVRTGVVLHPEGGALQKMLPAFRLGVGGPIGDGQQMMSWIHRDDMVAILHYLINQSGARGVYNATAPEPVSNQVFARELASALGRPGIIRTPSFALKLALGESATLLTEGQAVVPERLLQSGFEFQYPRLKEALSSFFASTFAST